MRSMNSCVEDYSLTSDEWKLDEDLVDEPPTLPEPERPVSVEAASESRDQEEVDPEVLEILEYLAAQDEAVLATPEVEDHASLLLEISERLERELPPAMESGADRGAEGLDQDDLELFESFAERSEADLAPSDVEDDQSLLNDFANLSESALSFSARSESEELDLDQVDPEVREILEQYAERSEGALAPSDVEDDQSLLNDFANLSESVLPFSARSESEDLDLDQVDPEVREILEQYAERSEADLAPSDVEDDQSLLNDFVNLSESALPFSVPSESEELDQAEPDDLDILEQFAHQSEVVLASPKFEPEPEDEESLLNEFADLSERTLTSATEVISDMADLDVFELLEQFAELSEVVIGAPEPEDDETLLNSFAELSETMLPSAVMDESKVLDQAEPHDLDILEQFADQTEAALAIPEPENDPSLMNEFSGILEGGPLLETPEIIEYNFENQEVSDPHMRELLEEVARRVAEADESQK